MGCHERYTLDDDDAGHGFPPEYRAMVLAEEADKRRAFEEYWDQRISSPAPIDPTSRFCPRCNGAGMLTDHYENGEIAHLDCFTCGGSGRIA